jgi:hypothetical protein
MQSGPNTLDELKYRVLFATLSPTVILAFFGAKVMPFRNTLLSAGEMGNCDKFNTKLRLIRLTSVWTSGGDGIIACKSDFIFRILGMSVCCKHHWLAGNVV